MLSAILDFLFKPFSDALSRARLWGTNLNEAVIDLCHHHRSDGFDIGLLQPMIDGGKIRPIYE